MSSELVERLREMVTEEPSGTKRKLMKTAAARIEALEAENAQLREALEPFAGLADRYDDTDWHRIDNSVELWQIDRNTGLSLRELALTVGHLRAARRAREGGNADG